MSVIPMRQTFSGSDVSPTAPAIMRAPLIEIEAAALALASAMGEDWATMPPALRRRFTTAQVVAGILINPNDTKLLAYVTEGQLSEEFPLWDFVYRRQQTMALACALSQAADILAGHQPRTLAARRALLASDEGQARTQHKGRGW